ncbi:hypothetical protein KIPB_004140 [Kipferlia bialata]|uniref:Uncharacterized protein n=1 Tax=Kipferlia bialata TaxID=797122 RepID=A0A9K3CVK0_9EUKA|nr:hypothetical protein KIPB_004140 [Kipferlia bialata]|eukprot:g4140.t1
MILAMGYAHRQFRHFHRHLRQWMEGVVPGHPMIRQYRHIADHPRRMMDPCQLETYDKWYEEEGREAWEALLREEGVGVDGEEEEDRESEGTDNVGECSV